MFKPIDPYFVYLLLYIYYILKIETIRANYHVCEDRTLKTGRQMSVNIRDVFKETKLKTLGVSFFFAEFKCQHLRDLIT